VVVEPRKASVAVHYRPDRLKVMLGKMVYEFQPKIDWANADEGKPARLGPPGCVPRRPKRPDLSC
jgi:hypothetical protein